MSYTFDKKINNILYLYFIISLVIFTGLRFETGGDWTTYQYNFNNNGRDFTFLDFTVRSDYGWELISYFLYQLDLKYFLLNFITSIFFFFAFSFYVSDYKYKLLSYIIAFPLIFTILLMGYSRQAIAFGFLLFSLKLLFNQKFILSFLFITVGICFHKSLLIFYFIFLLFPEKYIGFLKKKNNFFLLLYLFLIL